jgi:hypothetical protein
VAAAISPPNSLRPNRIFSGSLLGENILGQRRFLAVSAYHCYQHQDTGWQ